MQTWHAFLERMGWTGGQVDKVICHQVGSAHRDTILKALEIPDSKDLRDLSLSGKHGNRGVADDGCAGRASGISSSRATGWGSWASAAG